MIPYKELLPFCECGCGERVKKKGNRFIFNHHRRGEEASSETKDKMSKASKGKPKSSEHCLAISKGKTGITREPFSDEWKMAIGKGTKKRFEDPKERERQSKLTKGKNNPIYGRKNSQDFCSTMSETMKNSDACKSEHERQREGHDIVEHHYIYDHFDLSKYTTKMTRSKHTYIHNLMRKAGIKVPHINEE